MSGDPRKGALVPEMNVQLTAADSKIPVGAEVLFYLRRKLCLRNGIPLVQHTGRVMCILPGIGELTYLIGAYLDGFNVEMLKSGQLVPASDILAWTSFDDAARAPDGEGS